MGKSDADRPPTGEAEIESAELLLQQRDHRPPPAHRSRRARQRTTTRRSLGISKAVFVSAYCSSLVVLPTRLCSSHVAWLRAAGGSDKRTGA